MFGANLVIPTEIGDELSCRQVKSTDRRVDRRRDAGNNNTPSAWTARGNETKYASHTILRSGAK